MATTASMTTVTAGMGTMVTLSTSILGMLGQFPLNILCCGLVAGVAFGILRKTKKVAN
jgi:hypothetical protein